MSEPLFRILMSLSNKEGLIDLAKAIVALGGEIISTGGTWKAINEAGILVRKVSDFTGFEEMMEGRVKTLHPKIHAALLMLRDNPEHEKAMKIAFGKNLELLDGVFCNLYPFKATVAKEGITVAEIIDNIDIGGPAMLRSAAKNCLGEEGPFAAVDPEDYPQILQELKEGRGQITPALRKRLAGKVYRHTSKYDEMIADWFDAAA